MPEMLDFMDLGVSQKSLRQMVIHGVQQFSMSTGKLSESNLMAEEYLGDVETNADNCCDRQYAGIHDLLHFSVCT